MRLSSEQLARAASDSGFAVEPLEKVLYLLELLETLRSHPFLKHRLVLKGGTALNLFVLNLPRLSVDIDLNYVGGLDRETMLAERPTVEQAIHDVCGRLGLSVQRAADEHAGGKWRLRYTRTSGQAGNLELDLNFVLRAPLWPPVRRRSISLTSFVADDILVLDVHELAVGKLAALFGRDASRDLFDVRELLKWKDLDRERLRLGFVVYGAMNRRDWRDISLDDVRMSAVDADRRLIPLLHSDVVPVRADVASWCEELVEECRELLSCVMPLEAAEREFLEQVNDHGKILPELLTDDARMQDLIRSHPGLLWKVLNVQRRDERG